MIIKTLYGVKMQILVVGGAGYIGSIVVEELIKDKNVNKIIVLDDLSTGFKESIPSNIDFVLGSILDKNTLDNVFKENKIDLVIHLAAKTSVAESVLKPSEY
jgi:UDP-glucose 4-epimerase